MIFYFGLALTNTLNTIRNLTKNAD